MILSIGRTSVEMPRDLTAYSLMACKDGVILNTSPLKEERNFKFIKNLSLVFVPRKGELDHFCPMDIQEDF